METPLETWKGKKLEIGERFLPQPQNPAGPTTQTLGMSLICTFHFFFSPKSALSLSCHLSLKVLYH